MYWGFSCDLHPCDINPNIFAVSQLSVVTHLNFETPLVFPAVLNEPLGACYLPQKKNTHFTHPWLRDCPSAASLLRNHIPAFDWTISPVALSTNDVVASAHSQSQSCFSGIAGFTSRCLVSVRSQGKSNDGVRLCSGERSSTGISVTRCPTLPGLEPSHLSCCFVGCLGGGGFVCFFVCFLTPKSLIVSVKNCWLL